VGYIRKTPSFLHFENFIGEYVKSLHKIFVNSKPMFNLGRRDIYEINYVDPKL
jgi:hypothetical protein